MVDSLKRKPRVLRRRKWKLVKKRREQIEKELYQPLDTSWFDKDPHKYLFRDDFKKYQEISGVDFKDLLSKRPSKRRLAQEKIVEQTAIFNEIRKAYAGYRMPLFYYTHDLRLMNKLKNPNPELEKLGLAFDMGDSLRRRHMALSHVIIPQKILEIRDKFKEPIMIKNLGSGIGLDVINAVTKTNGFVKKVLNYDTDQEAIKLGKKITTYLEKDGKINKEVIEYIPMTLSKSKEKAHAIVMIGVICSLRDDPSYNLVKKCYDSLEDNGSLFISSSNFNMIQTDPLPSFIIQHIGMEENPLKGWGLNGRNKYTMYGLLSNAGFKDIEIYDDVDFPGRESISNELLYGIEGLPAKALGYEPLKKPLNLPSKEVLEKRIGYNWIAVATK